MSLSVREFPLLVCTKDDTHKLVYAKFRENLVIDLKAAKEVVANRLEFTENKKYYAIMDISNVREVTADAKEYFLIPEKGLKNILAAAFVGQSLVSELLSTVFIKASSAIEAKFFTNMNEAESWILSLQKK